jgi:hypothetical protein
VPVACMMRRGEPGVKLLTVSAYLQAALRRYAWLYSGDHCLPLFPAPAYHQAHLRGVHQGIEQAQGMDPPPRSLPPQVVIPRTYLLQ